jgi:hypothetical protein
MKKFAYRFYDTKYVPRVLEIRPVLTSKEAEEIHELYNARVRYVYSTNEVNVCFLSGESDEVRLK